MPSNQKFEYEVRRVEHANIERELNHMARHGWRFIEFAPGSSFDIKCVFERSSEHPTYVLATNISFRETTMLPVQAGNTLVYTGTLTPAGSILAPDFVATVTSNDPAVVPTVDPTGLIVTVPLPAGWVESTTTPLAITYATTSASTGQALAGTITPGAETVLATGVTFAQTT